MKRNIKLTSFLIVVSLASILLSGCMPSKSADAEKNLKDNNYTVISSTSENKVTFGIQKLALSVYLNFGNTSTDDSVVLDGVNAIVGGVNGSENCYLVYFNETEQAKKCFDSLLKRQENQLKAIEAKKDSLTADEYKKQKESVSNIKIGSNTKLVYMGTKNALDACK